MFFDVGTKYHTKSDHKTKQNVPILHVEKIKFFNKKYDVNRFQEPRTQWYGLGSFKLPT